MGGNRLDAPDAHHGDTQHGHYDTPDPECCLICHNPCLHGLFCGQQQRHSCVQGEFYSGTLCECSYMCRIIG